MLLLSAEASFPSSRVALSFESSLLSTFLKGSSLAALPLRTKDVDIPYFVQNFLLALLAYMESAATHLTLTFISFCCIQIQSFKRIPSLIPLTVFKEAVINALSHRDYYEQGASIMIEMFDDRIEIYNPEELLPIVAKDFGHKSMTRNSANFRFIYPYALGRKSCIRYSSYAGSHEGSKFARTGISYGRNVYSGVQTSNH